MRPPNPITSTASPTSIGVPQTSGGFDWIKRGKTMFKWVYPKPVTDEELEWFGDGLKDIIPAKLQECIGRQEKLKKLKLEVGLVTIKAKKRSLARWFLEELQSGDFEEYFVIHKWMLHWLGLWERITGERFTLPKYNNFEPFEVSRAKQFPMEELFPTELRKTGKQWMGKCPFHEEKTASFAIFPDNNGKCFGCAWSGDSIKFLMDLKKYTFPEAVRNLL